MKPSHRLLAAAASVLFGLAPLGVATAASAAATSPGITLPIAHFSHLVVDQPHGHLFISGGAGTNQILVTNLQGSTVTNIPLPTGATGLALSADGATLYVALPDSNAITAIDTTTLSQKASYPTGAGTHPDSLVIAGGTLWFGYGTSGASNIGSISDNGTVALGLDATTWPQAPTLGTSPGSSSILVAGAVDWSTQTSALSVYTAGASGLTRTAHTTGLSLNVGDLAVTPDGKQVIADSNDSGVSGRFNTSNLAQTWPAPPLGGNVLAAAPDGTVAESNGTRDYGVADAGSTGLYRYYTLPVGYQVAPHGLAFAPDGSRLFAVAVDAATGSPSLQVQQQPEVSWNELGVDDATLPYTPGEPLRLHIWSNSGVAPLAGQVMHVTRFDQDHPAGVALPDLTWDPRNGWAPLQDTVPAHGPLSYRIDNTGDAHHVTATLAFSVNIATYAPTLTLHAPSTAPRGTALNLTGKLTWPHSHLNTGTVHVNRTDLAHPHGYSLGTIPISADGTFTLHDTPAIGGANTYSFTYDGGTTYLPATASATVQVTRTAAQLAVSTDKNIYNYGAWAKITAHLGATYNSRTVTIYAHPADGGPATVTTGTVDAHGNLTAWYKVTRNTTFTAAFTGDYRFAPATATPAITYTHAQVNLSMLKATGSARVGDTPYAVYYRNTGIQPLLQVNVSPDHPGQDLVLVVQRYTNGNWRTVTTTSSNHLNSHSGIDIPLPWNSMPDNALYRLTVQYNHDATDNSNIDTWGAWQYFTIHRHP